MTPAAPRKSLRNTGTLDRWVRIALGAGVLAMMFVGPKTPLELLGFIPLFSGLFGHCPVYGWLGVDTTAKHREAPEPQRTSQSPEPELRTFGAAKTYELKV